MGFPYLNLMHLQMVNPALAADREAETTLYGFVCKVQTEYFTVSFLFLS